LFIRSVDEEKSLRLLIETGKHANVSSYETLMECAFGSAGFVFISVNMFIMAYGAMMIYLIIIKQTVPMLFGVAEDNLPLKRSILALSSLSIILPLSCQRVRNPYSFSLALLQ
jgi:sodium-coupled neutral amino acid transporter 11